MEAVAYPNVLALLEDRAKQFSDKPFVWEKNQLWHPLSWSLFTHEARVFASALLALGLKSGDGVSILSANRKEWPICDMGAIYAGGISVGLYLSSSASQCEYMIRHSDSSVIIVDTQLQLEKILSVRQNLHDLKQIVVLDQSVPSDPGHSIWNYIDFMQIGLAHAEKYDSTLNERVQNSSQEDIIMYVYTSGTTGDPKAAMISNRYFLYNGNSINNVFRFQPGEKILSFLPYCHVGERIFGFAVTLIAARQTFLVQDYAKVIDSILEVEPNIFGGVPRLYEKMYGKIISYLQQLPPHQQVKIRSAMDVSKFYFNLKLNNKTVPTELERSYQIADQEALGPLRKLVFGKNMRICTSGAAALPKDMAEFFVSIGSPIYEAYGLTENISVAMNRPNKHRVTTVGIAMPYTEIKLAEDGEILIKGQNIFSGYYKNPEVTRDMFDDQMDWMKTGDIGKIDDDGFLTIVDRKKELIITSTGKNISPTGIENKLKYDTVVSQVMIVGEGKSYICALITINPIEAVRTIKKLLEQLPSAVIGYIDCGKIPDAETVRLIAEHPLVRDHIQKTIDRVNTELNHTEQIKKIALLPFDFAIDRDEITPTLKLKRKVIAERYKDVIENLYR